LTRLSRMRLRDFTNTAADVPTRLKDPIPPSRVSAYCVFSKPVALSVTIAGKTMVLLFNVAWRCRNSKNLLVDGLPFQEGRFERVLARNRRRGGGRVC
jgi:hypothetical protein